ncbi:hypothetical protein C0J52_19410 [Blattella germanica]|nr:hypothetical protein C0J52_19410 [Blattella germanica]
MNKEERLHVVTLRIQGNKCNVIRQKFQRRFHKPGPTDKAIRELLRKFYATGSVLDAKRSGRPSTPDQSVELTRELFEEEPGMSLRRASDRLQIPRATIHKILKTTLRKKAYHIQVLHDLHEEDYPTRAAMCAELIDQIEQEGLMDHILFSDEATFHTCGKVNRHNCRIWATEKPQEFVTWERDSGMTKSQVYGPYFFNEKTVTGIVYLDMLQQFLEPQLIQDGIIHDVVFQQDGAPCHYANIMKDYLNDRFPNRWIGRGGNRPWAPRSPDLTPLDFFAWGFIKSKVYQNKINDLVVLKARIRQAVAAITPRMLENVFRETVTRFELCRDTDGAHVETH